MPDTTDKNIPIIPEPTLDLQAMYTTLQALRSAVQVLTGQGNPNTKSLQSQFNTLGASVKRNQSAYLAGSQKIAKIVDEVKATADGISAGGRLKFLASAGPVGYSAQYTLSLAAGNASAGFSVMAKQNPDGSYASAIALAANQFLLLDPDLGPTPVFNYMSGTFQFNVPVIIMGEQIETRGITNSDIQINNSNIADKVVCTLTTRDNAQIDIYAQFDGQPTQGFPPGEAGTKLLRLLRTGPDGTVITLRDVIVQFYVIRNSGTNTFYFTQTNMIYRDNPPPGTNIYTLQMVQGTPQGPLSLSVVERHR